MDRISSACIGLPDYPKKWACPECRRKFQNEPGHVTEAERKIFQSEMNVSRFSPSHQIFLLTFVQRKYRVIRPPKSGADTLLAPSVLLHLVVDGQPNLATTWFPVIRAQLEDKFHMHASDIVSTSVAFPYMLC